MDFQYSNYKYIVSLDFGDSFSGVCVATTGNLSPRELREQPYPSIIHVANWPKQKDLEHKTPTIIVYDQTFLLLHWENSAYNFIAKGLLTKGDHVFKHFSLGLPTSIAQTGAFCTAGSTTNHQLLCMRATIDFFREIFDCTVKNIQNVKTVDGLKAEKKDFCFVITVPEQWSDSQRAIMRVIAVEAGLISKDDHEKRLAFISETLATIIYCENTPDTVKSENMDCETRSIYKGEKYMNIAIGERTTRATIFESTQCDQKGRCQLLSAAGNRWGLMHLDLIMKELFWAFVLVFGTARPDFIPQCCLENFEKYSDIESDLSDAEELFCNYCNFSNGHDENFVELDDFGDVKSNDDSCEIILSYRYMRENVFDHVTNNVIEFVRTQMKKIGGNITRTYLTGGSGEIPYIKKRFLNEFPKYSPLYLGNLASDYKDDTAIMKGALIYGIDASRKEPQSPVIASKYEDDNTSQYNTLVCLDIGYNKTACSYRDLRYSSDAMTDITDWPGLKERNFAIPTAKETLDGKTLWGAQIGQTHIFKPESFVTPSKLMSAVNGIFKSYLIDFLELVFKHVHCVIAKANPKLSDKRKYRYVITIENCHPFFKHKSEMRLIAQEAGIINKEDHVKRMLLIGRENAAAMYLDKTFFAEKKSDVNQILQISLYHDTCHLSLHESTNLTSYEAPDSNNSLGSFTPYKSRNVRTMRSATFQFNFLSELVANLSVFISNLACCKDQKSHDTNSSAYVLKLTKEFLVYMKNKLDFGNDEAQTIQVTELPGCHISVTKYEVLEHVFWPSIRELTSAVKCNGMQRNVFRLFNINKIDKIFLSGVLIEAKKETYDFLEKTIIKNLTQVMNVKQGVISPSVVSGKEALLGAAQYGNHPESFTERISRKSYAVQVCGYKCLELDDAIQRSVLKIEMKSEKSMKDDIYTLEAANVFIEKKKVVQLCYYSSSNLFNLKHEESIRHPKDITSLIKCIVQVTIYSSEDPILSKSELEIDSKNFDKIHQFELYIKRDVDDPTTVLPDSRLYFDVCLKFDKDKCRFGAYVCSKLGDPAPEFILQDEFLVTNNYGDE
ncbi:hypothetical protein INT47_009119 [Mucor saturninus]|uniref:Uncharacterized protein n=1 Tax=Mucor saturninus TaxID=64648 RepID=A0A8H7RMU9_9FUNG|nr:hypothetical protein INT47_009119 [Mucor saturninus]